MEQPHPGQIGVSPQWPQLEMLGLRTPRPPVLLRQPCVRIGSGAGTQIRLNSPAIAAIHAELSFSSNGCLLRDLDSASGTFVNDKRVREALLNDQDQIRIGPFVFRYSAAAAGAASALKQPAAPLPAPPTPPPTPPPPPPPILALSAARTPVVSSAAAPSSQAVARSQLLSPAVPPQNREAASTEHLKQSVAAPQSPLATVPAPLPKPPAAVRLRRREIAREDYTQSASPVPETADSANEADDADLPEDEEDQLEPQTPRGRVERPLGIPTAVDRVAQSGEEGAGAEGGTSVPLRQLRLPAQEVSAGRGRHMLAA